MGDSGEKYKSLIDSVNDISLDQFDEIIRADLDTAKDNWQDLKNYTDKLYEGAKIAQNK